MEEDKEAEIIEQLYGDAFVDTTDVRSVRTTMRTLYDHETLDCMRRAAGEESDLEMREFLKKRWQLSYSLTQVDSVSFEDEDVIDKFQRILRMPSIVVDALYIRFTELCMREFEMMQLLGESGGMQTQ